MICQTKLKKNGTTSAGTPRYRCPNCGASSTGARTLSTRRTELRIFLDWLLGPAPQTAVEHFGTARTFRRRTQWCWRITPTVSTTGEIHDQIMLDGTYFNGWCALIAYTGTEVLDWQWCDREKTASWTALISRIPAPRYAVVDGNGPLITTIETLWPGTGIQRCFFHIRQAGHRHLTRNPALPANQELLRLYQALSGVKNRDHAAAWLAQFASWEAKWSGFIKHRTRAKDVSARPSHVRRGQSWWYTHLRTRRAYFFLAKIIAKGYLFTWLDAADEGIVLARTTNALEGGVNAGVKGLLRAHRGLVPEHARRGVDWFLFECSHRAGSGWSLVRPDHWAPPKRVVTVVDQGSIGPVEYGTGFSWEDGIGIQKGWGGRRR